MGQKKMSEWLLISNIFSLLRIVLIIPVVVLLINEHTIAALIIGVIAGFTDFLDGYFARKYNQVTELGKILDPIADKLFLGAIALTIMIQEIIPFWFFAALVIRDGLILIGGMYAKKKLNFVLPSNFEGKVTFVLMSLVITGILLNYTPAYIYGMYLAVAAMIYTLVLYFIRLVKELKIERNKSIL